MWKKDHIKKDWSSKGNGFDGNPPKKSSNEILEWVTKNPSFLDTRYLETSTMNRNNKKYKCCTSCNNGNGAWEFYWKDVHEKWKNKQGNNSYVCFYNPATNEMNYCSYLMTISEDDI